MSSRLDQKIAIVTGAGSGIGRAAARRFAAEGAAVVCADISGESAEQTAADARAGGASAIASQVDVSKGADVSRLVDECVAAYGRVDVLYSNAGVGGVGNAVDVDEAEWQRVIGVNLTGVWLCAKYALPHLVAAGAGSIVNQASIGGIVGVPAVAAYAAAKAGVIGLTKQMALDFAPSNVRVNAIAPGTVSTPLVQGIWEQGAGLVSGGDLAAREAAAAAIYPLRRIGTPDDIANLALFLASDEANWITGAVYVIDGGKSAS
jgi:NAD(P)-dependent dehydrogenase (short-subunit alcohol dehydrogenase family)